MKSLEELWQERNLAIMGVGEDGGYGVIEYGKLRGSVIWSDGGGWEHVSVAPFRHSYVPSWAEMCRIKDIFWNDDEVVVQYHPRKSEYVNNMENCLHLWRPIKEILPTPHTIMVGVRDGQSMESVRKEIDEVQEGRKCGKWIDDELIGKCRCPFCDKEWSWYDNDTETFAFCPNCGADLRGDT